MVLIAQITDTHIGFDRGNPDEHNLQRLKAVLRRLAEGPNRPDLLLVTGDLTEHGDPESYAVLAEALKACPFPVQVMVGNHDEREALLAAFPGTPGEGGFVQFPLEFDGLRLLVLDTLAPGRHGGAFCAARAAWLEAQLAAKPDVPTVIAMHHPPFASGIAWLDSDEREDWIDRFSKAVAGHGQVKAIIAGHLHRTIHTLWNGVALTVCSSSAPTVALDLTPIDIDRPDGRALIVGEPPSFALHCWTGTRLISHVEAVGPVDTLARFDENLQRIVRLIDSERPN
jgi:3',5'-cyclic-AMP phosphodiesterase